tara:strand:- start:285 stop:551 length:267 start_codon:yes stop_codon:yes gene_type:complete
MVIIIAILQAIVIAAFSSAWNVMHPAFGALMGFIGFFITFLLIGIVIVLIDRSGIKIEGMVFYILIFIISLSFWLGFLRLVKRIKEDR